MYDAFFSYATEDSSEADIIVQNCLKYGFKIWYSPISLEPGTKLLQSIDEGLKHSSSGILLLSKNYLNKKWPKYEFDTLMRQHIENDKKLLPIWYNVQKKDIEEFSSGLSGIVGIVSSNINIDVFEKVRKILSKNAPTIGIIPIYQNPKYLFLEGRGEIVIGTPDGPATSLWELIIHLGSDKYPIFIEGDLFSREDILIYAANSIMHIPEVVERFVGSKGRLNILETLKREGVYISE